MNISTDSGTQRERPHRSFCRRLALTTAVSGLGGLIVFGLYRYYLRSNATRVTLKNVGTSELHDVVVHTPGRSYSVGTIGPGASAMVYVFPNRESGLLVDFNSADGKARKLDIGGYFGPNIAAEVTIELDSQRIRSRKTKYR